MTITKAGEIVRNMIDVSAAKMNALDASDMLTRNAVADILDALRTAYMALIVEDVKHV